VGGPGWAGGEPPRPTSSGAVPRLATSPYSTPSLRRRSPFPDPAGESVFPIQNGEPIRTWALQNPLLFVLSRCGNSASRRWQCPQSAHCQGEAGGRAFGPDSGSRGDRPNRQSPRDTSPAPSIIRPRGDSCGRPRPVSGCRGCVLHDPAENPGCAPPIAPMDPLPSRFLRPTWRPGPIPRRLCSYASPATPARRSPETPAPPSGPPQGSMGARGRAYSMAPMMSPAPIPPREGKSSAPPKLADSPIPKLAHFCRLAGPAKRIRARGMGSSGGLARGSRQDPERRSGRAPLDNHKA
jgi:hypothetical protein